MAIGIRQMAGIADREIGAVTNWPRPGKRNVGGGNVDPAHPAAPPLGEAQRQAAGAAADIEDRPILRQSGEFREGTGEHPRPAAEKTLIVGAVTGPVGRGARGGRGGHHRTIAISAGAFIGLSLRGAARRRSNPDVRRIPSSEIASLRSQ
jgi:hypothetical protein